MPPMRLALAFFLAWTGLAQADTPPKRIVSLNLCSDQLLLALADPDQIAALSPYAHNREMSLLADAAAAYPVVPGNAEAAFALQPDLVLSGTFSNQLTIQFLRGKGIPLFVMEPVRTFDEIRDQIRLVAGAVGHPARGEAMIGAIDAAVAKAEAARPAEPLTAVSLARRGWISGVESLDSEVMDAVGIRNAAAEFGVRPSGGTVSLEALVAADLDILLVDKESVVAEDQGAALLRHPALDAAYPADRRLVVAGPLTICGGPGVITALDRLAGQVAAVRR